MNKWLFKMDFDSWSYFGNCSLHVRVRVRACVFVCVCGMYENIYIYIHTHTHKHICAINFRHSSRNDTF